jgi:hypothetical protein
VEVDGRLLKWWIVLYTLTRLWMRGEIEKYTRALTCLPSPGMVRCGDAMLWVHDVRLNGPQKFNPKPRKVGASFYRLRDVVTLSGFFL